VVIENRAGAGGLIGTASVAKADPDGHMPQVGADNWYGLVVAAATPAAIAEKLQAAAVEALHSAEVKDKYLSQGAMVGTPNLALRKDSMPRPSHAHRQATERRRQPPPTGALPRSVAQLPALFWLRLLGSVVLVHRRAFAVVTAVPEFLAP
jgi:Tripartite tricarboxylate transporter family receptor